MPPNSAVTSPTSMVFQIERMASGLSNSRSKWISEYCFMSNRLDMSRMNMNLRKPATTSAKVGSTTTTTR
jgi:hypothetical protein